MPPLVGLVVTPPDRAPAEPECLALAQPSVEPEQHLTVRLCLTGYISKELTLHYHRGVYLIESNPEALELRGKRCRVHAYADGRIELRYRGRSFPFRAFDENRRVTQADIVSNKRLGDVVQKIQAKQRKRDEGLLANKSVTLRRKKQIRTARAQADGLPGSS